MTGAAAVLFTIIIPTAAEELRLKNAYLSKQSGAESTVAQSQQTLQLNESESAPAIQAQLPQITIHEPEEFDLPIDASMEQVLREILRKFQIVNAIWLSNLEANKYHINFTIEFDELYEQLHTALQDWGIGEREHTSVSVVSCIASSQSHVTAENCDAELPHSTQNNDNFNAQKHGAWDRFMNTVRSRLNVAQIVRDVRQDASITFDFCILLVSAAILASFGLVENSTIFLASSMLISPLMGPIIAAIFGTVIEERSLRRQGMRNELIGILLATLVGFIFGLVVCTTDTKYGIGEGLTDEMLSRCNLRSLVVGIFTAIPSGAAAAIGILGGNIGSLVGVAISASLLPPAVNSGLLWALACIYKFFESDDSRYLYVVKSRHYSENQAAELAILGSISMCLTLSNVLCVYIMGILVLKVKEIAPAIARNNRRFWKYDIKLARGRAQPDLVSTDAAIFDEFSNLDKADQQALGIDCDFLRTLDETAYQHTWSPLTQRFSFEAPEQQQLRGSFSTVHRLEQLYTTISNTTEQRGMEHLHYRQKQAHKVMRRATQRPSDVINPLPLLEPRPRFATMPSTNSKDHLETIIPVANTNKPKRFTVTPANDAIF